MNKWMYIFGFQGLHDISESEAEIIINKLEKIDPLELGVLSPTIGIVPKPRGDEYDKELKQRSDVLIKNIQKALECQTI
jgi:hypothetical protein